MKIDQIQLISYLLIGIKCVFALPMKGNYDSLNLVLVPVSRLPDEDFGRYLADEMASRRSSQSGKSELSIPIGVPTKTKRFMHRLQSALSGTKSQPGPQIVELDSNNLR